MICDLVLFGYSMYSFILPPKTVTQITRCVNVTTDTVDRITLITCKAHIFVATTIVNYWLVINLVNSSLVDF